ncbi:hypothetical protein FRC19_010010 [Serendipita sp. 401]|nr:hypothetical protein FRC16_008262 [Serendipita sp. 398]KAG8826006.1 hypothetical protein FRC19_010010 [Serendipita sp. 401]KAG8872551.1 hypothetical protein FRC20_009402 [Serendipita sp. 405]
MTAISLSPIPSLQSLPTSDFAGSIVLGMMDRAVFERVTEEDEGEIAGAENLSQLSRPQLQGQTPVRVVVSPDTTTDNSREMLLQQGGFPMTSTPTTHLSTAYGKQASRGAGVATINHTNGSVHSSEAGASIVPSPSPVPSLLQQHPQLQHLHQQFSPSPVPSTLGNSPSPSSVGLRQAQSPSPSLIGSPALSSSTSVLSPVSHSPVLSSSSSSPLPTLPMLRNAHSNKPVMSSTNSITSRIKAGLSFVSGGNSGKKSGNGSGNGLNETISHSSIDSSSSFGTGVIPSSSFSHGGTGPTTTNGVVGKGKAPARSETPVLDIRHPSPSSLPYLDSYQDASGTDGIPSSIGTIRRANSANALNSFASSSSITSASMAAYAGPVSGQAYGAGSTPVPLARERALSAGNALNRSVAVYSSNAPTGPHPEDPLTLFSVYNQQQQHQQSPSVINSGASTPRSPSSLGHRSQQGYTSPDLGGSKRLGGVTPTNTERLLEPPIASTGLTGRLSPSPSPYAAAPTRNGEPGHSRQMSSSSTSGSDLDLSRYSFPDAPGHPPVMTGFNGKRKEHIEPLQVIVESMGSPSGSVEGLMVRRGSEPVMRSELHGHSHNLTSNMNNNSNYINNNALPPPPLASLPLPVLVSKSAGRAPIQPGAYQAGLRAVMDEATVIPDGTPPPYQPRASTRRYTDPSVPDSPPTEDMDPLTPTSYGYGTPTVAGSPTVVASPAYRVTSPHRPTMVVNNQQVSRLDTSPNTLRRPSAKGPVPSSPLSEVFIPDNGMGEGSSPVEQYYPTDPKAEKMQQMNGGGEKMHHGVGHQRTGSNRRPSDPYQRILAAAAVSKSNNPTPTPSRRGSSSQVQGLSPPLSGGFSSSGSADAFDENDVRSRPPSQAFSTYTRGTRFSTWGGSQATATAVDHHDNDFPNGLEEDDGVFYTSVLGDFDRYDQQEKNKSVKEHLMAKENNMLTSPPAHPLPSTPPLTPPSTRNTRSSSLGKDPSWQSRYSPSPPVPPMPKHLLAAVKQQQQIFAQQQQQLQQQQQATLGRSTPLGRQLPTPPVGPPPLPPMMHHPHFPGGMGWDELHRPVPRKLSKMEKALLRRVEFGAVGAADIAAIPLA